MFCQIALFCSRSKSNHKCTGALTLLSRTLLNRNLLYRKLLNHTLLNQETAKPYFAKPYSAKQESGKTLFRNLLNHTLLNRTLIKHSSYKQESGKPSGQPKGLFFGFRPKISVSVSAEMFLQKSSFRPKGHIRQKRSISAEITLFRQVILMVFWPKDLISAEITLLSAEIPSFGSFSCFLLSAEIAGFKIPPFGYGRNSFG